MIESRGLQRSLLRAAHGIAVAYTRASRKDPWVSAADTLPWRGTAAGGGDSTAAGRIAFFAAARLPAS